MTKPIKYTATYGGKIIGTRKSPRPYLFAIIVQSLEEVARLHAYHFEPAETDLLNFNWHTEGATAAVGKSKFHGIKSSVWSVEDIAESKRKIEGGWDAYVARLRTAAIENFERRKAAGHFEPCVFGWSMTRHNAEKMAAYAAHPSRAVLGIVPAEAK